MNETVKNYIESNKLKQNKDGSFWTDDYLFVAKRDKYVDLYIQLVQGMISDKPNGKLSKRKCSTDFEKGLRDSILKDPVNDFEILYEDEDYVVYTDSIYLSDNNEV